MGMKTRRKFASSVAAMAAFLTGTKLFAHQASTTGTSAPNPSKDGRRSMSGEHHTVKWHLLPEVAVKPRPLRAGI